MDKELVLSTENLKKACEVFDLDFDKIIKGETSNPFLEKKEDKKDEIVKAEVSDINKQEQNADILFKALGVDANTLKVAVQVLPKVTQMAELIKGFESSLGQLHLEDEKESVVNKVNSLIKGYNDMSELNKDLKDNLKKAQNTILSLTNKVELIERVPLREKKSITSDKIEKSFGQDDVNNMEGKTVYSISRNKSTINSLLGDRMQEEILKGIQDGTFAQAAITFEASGRLSRQAIEALNKDNIVLVQ